MGIGSYRGYLGFEEEKKSFRPHSLDSMFLKLFPVLTSSQIISLAYKNVRMFVIEACIKLAPSILP